jgi:predicted O-methyltransferase YrrM
MQKYNFSDEVFGAQGKAIRHLWIMALIGAYSKTKKNISVLEIGSWAGYSCATWAEAISIHVSDVENSSITCVDLWASYFSANDLSSGKPVYEAMNKAATENLIYPIYLENSQKISANTNVKINTCKGNSADVLTQFEPKSFDIIFIDASHYYSSVCLDINLSIPLLKDNGILCEDDLELQQNELNIDLLSNIDNIDILYHKGHQTNFHPGVTKAVGELIGPVSTYNGLSSINLDGKIRPYNIDEQYISYPSHFTEREKGFIRHDINVGVLNLTDLDVIKRLI